MVFPSTIAKHFLETLDKELQTHITKAEPSVVNIESGEVLRVKAIQEGANTNDTSPSIGMAATPTSVEFVRKHLTSMYDTALSPRERQNEIASQLVFKLAELSDLSRTDKVNRSSELTDWVKYYAKANNIDITLNNEAR